jgi:hypothetical protein
LKGCRGQEEEEKSGQDEQDEQDGRRRAEILIFSVSHILSILFILSKIPDSG